jgi:hypothetical protein
LKGFVKIRIRNVRIEMIINWWPLVSFYDVLFAKFPFDNELTIFINYISQIPLLE